jgi:hypothetical protein
MRKFMLLVVAVGALALSVPAALASTNTGTGEADGIEVSVTLSNTAVAGQPFTVAESIANKTSRGKFVRVTQTLSGESGTIFSIRYPLFLPANKTLAFDVMFTFPANVPPGDYRLTLTAGNATAFATTTVPEPT